MLIEAEAGILSIRFDDATLGAPRANLRGRSVGHYLEGTVTHPGATTETTPMQISEGGTVPWLIGRGADRLTLRRPDDWHVHLRDGAMLSSIVNYTARQFARAIVMPSLAPPITTIAAAVGYRERILTALEPGLDFSPLMTCYLTTALTLTRSSVVLPKLS